MDPIEFDAPDFATRKQLNYEQSRVKDILHAFCGGKNVNPFQVTALVREAGSQLGFSWFNEKFASCPVAIEATKLKKPIKLSLLVSNKLRQLEFFKAYVEVQSNYDRDRPLALVFDCHGDEVSDLVIHNVQNFDAESRFSCRLRPEWPHEYPTYWVTTWSDFCESVSRRYHPYM